MIHADGFQVAQYIGETCRYLLNQPEQPHDKQHQVSYHPPSERERCNRFRSLYLVLLLVWCVDV